MVKRAKLWKVMEEKGVRKGLIERVKEIYEATRSVIRAQGGEFEEFWMNDGLKEGCPLSPTLFTIFMADMEEEFKEGQTGGIRVGNRKFWSLVYADDVVILVKKEEELRVMMRRLERYLVRKGLELNAEKTDNGM